MKFLLKILVFLFAPIFKLFEKIFEALINAINAPFDALSNFVNKKAKQFFKSIWDFIWTRNVNVNDGYGNVPKYTNNDLKGKYSMVNEGMNTKKMKELLQVDDLLFVEESIQYWVAMEDADKEEYQAIKNQLCSIEKQSENPK